MTYLRRSGISLMLLPLLTACVAPGNRPMPLAASGPQSVVQDGLGYMVDLQPTVSSAELTVSADAGAMTMDQGLVAKRVAENFCTWRGAALDRRALGRFSSGTWVFDGGCSA